MADPFSADSGGQALSLNPTLGTTELRGTPHVRYGSSFKCTKPFILRQVTCKTNRVIVGNMAVFKG